MTLKHLTIIEDAKDKNRDPINIAVSHVNGEVYFYNWEGETTELILIVPADDLACLPEELNL